VAKSSIGIGIICKNGEKTIGDCIDSLLPWVEQVAVSVDETTTDETARVAADHGAEVYPGLVVSEWHECPQHGRVLAQHFARARTRNWGHLRKDLTWHGWVDADDQLIGGDKLEAFLAQTTPNIDGVWLPYHYATVAGTGAVTTLFHRERLVRASKPWEWMHRVHEVLAPVGRRVEEVQWVQSDQIVVLHQSEGHDTSGSARRNILLLELDLEENPEDQRALFYLGNQYFALSEWQKAIYYYERAMGNNNVYQMWQTAIYLSMAYEKLGMLNEARGAAWRACDIAPFHPEPYFRLAAIYMLQRDVAKCEFWTRFGEQRQEAPFFAFKNPLDRTYNAPLTLGAAYLNDGQVSKAKREFERAGQAIDSGATREGIANTTKLEEGAQTAEAVLRVLAGRTDEDMLALYKRLDVPPDIKQFGRLRDFVVPAMLRQRPNTQPRIIFWCSRSLEPWYPGSIETTGIGGSETAVIKIAERFARDGWRVDVYNEPERWEGEYDGVGYWGCGRLASGDRPEVLVSWRDPGLSESLIAGRMSFLWCHDLNRGPGAESAYARWDRVLGVSNWHATYLASVYGLTNTGFVPNGIDLARFAGPIKKVPGRCVYTSSPDRGLEKLLQMWPVFYQADPGRELHVAYGWETFDKYIAMGRQDLAQQKERLLKALDQPGVVWRGRLNQSDLAKLYQESYAWLYPTSFTEVSCISAMEAMAGGCVPVCSEVGALKETVGEAGVIVKGNTYTHAWGQFWIMCAQGVLASPETRMPLAYKGLARAREFTWDKSYQDHWKPLVSSLLEGKKEREVELVEAAV